MMKILGIGICFAIMLGAFLQIGPDLYLDINSALFVLVGATGFSVMKNNPKNHIKKFWARCCLFRLVGNFNRIDSHHWQQLHGLG